MDANTEQNSRPSVLDPRTNQLSRKVWDMEISKDKVMNINANGTVPMRTQMRMKENIMHLTDYIDSSTGKRRYVQKINGVIEIKDI